MEQEGKKLSDLISQLNGITTLHSDTYDNEHSDSGQLYCSVMVEIQYPGADTMLRNLFLRLNREGITNTLSYGFNQGTVVNIFTFDFNHDEFDTIYGKMESIIKEFNTV